MWRSCLAVLATAVATVLGGTAYAMDAIAHSALGAGGSLIQEFRAGDGFDIVGDCLALARSSRDVRVVLSLSDRPAAASVGYSSVLVTEQKLDTNALHVRVPEMPEMSHHTYRVKVFAVDSEAPSACEAGQIRIG
jgi:hypothetical protein